MSFSNVKIYRFGSRACGTNTEVFDVDRAIDAGHKMEFSFIGEARDVMKALDIPYKIDVVDFYRIPEDLRKTTLEERIQWK